MNFFKVGEAIEALNSGELLYIDMINSKTKEREVCVSVSDMAKFRAKCSECKDSDFIYTFLTPFDDISIDEIIKEFKAQK